MKTKLSLLLVATLLWLPACATNKTPAKSATDTMFITAKGVNDAYAAYLDGIFAGQIKTNDFPKVTQDYRNFQQIFAVAVAELPGTNGVPGVVVQGAAVVTDVAKAKAKGAK